MEESIQLKVAPEILKTKAEEIQTCIGNLELQWGFLRHKITNSKFYWEGALSERHQSYLKGMETDVSIVIKRLKEHPRDLLDMANIYGAVETDVKTLINSLPEDIIV